MSQAQKTIQLRSKRDLPGLPDAPISPTDQLIALKRVQAQAEQRVKLGVQLFKAAEAHTTGQQVAINDLKDEQQKLRSELHEDVTKSLHAYDQWVGRIDESFTRAMQKLEGKIDTLEENWQNTQTRIEAMLRRSEALLDQSRYLNDRPATNTTAQSNKRIVVRAPEIETLPKPPMPTPKPRPAAQQPKQPLSVSPTKLDHPAPKNTNPNPNKPISYSKILNDMTADSETDTYQ